MLSVYTGTIALVAALAAALPPSEGSQKRLNIPKPYHVDYEKMEAVKDVFQRSWDVYYEFAFPNDSLRPVTRDFQNDRNGWGASAVDALTTAIVMGNSVVVKDILEYIPLIDFGVAEGDVSLFETTIRYLGGLVSAYDLLTRPQRELAVNTGEVKELLTQATRLAGYLSVAFDTPSGVPENTLIYDPVPRRMGGETNALATIGTLVLEWTRLSDLTSDPSWGELAQRGEEYLLRPKGAKSVETYFNSRGDFLGEKEVNVEPEPFPGLLGYNVNVTTGEFIDDHGSWGGGTDSFYEYLIKMYLYDTVKYSEYKDRWIKAADSSMEYLRSHPSTKPELTYLSAWDGKELLTTSQHLACFDGGNFILGGLLLDIQKYVDFGLELAASCHALYTSTLTGIGPEGFAWQDSRVVEARGRVDNDSSATNSDIPSPKTLDENATQTLSSQVAGAHTTASSPLPDKFPATKTTTTVATGSPTIYEFSNGAWISAIPEPPVNQREFYNQSGFWITEASYILRPEVVESYYYAYRATGDRKYQDWAWEAFEAINRTCAVWAPADVLVNHSTIAGSTDEVFVGYSSLKDVNAEHGGGFRNEMESFWFAEVLKYLYLIFAEDFEFQVKTDHSNKWVFNTEAHPVMINGHPR